jgi:hypothetical protein
MLKRQESKREWLKKLPERRLLERLSKMNKIRSIICPWLKLPNT